MNSRPFLADCAKVYDESCFTSAPAQFGQNHLLVTYGQQRRIFDTAATSITGQPHQQLQPSPTFQQYGLFPQRPQFQQNVISPVRQTIPTGVTYSFPQAEQPVANNFRELGIDYNGYPPNFNNNMQQPQVQPQCRPLRQAQSQVQNQLTQISQPQVQQPSPGQFSCIHPQMQSQNQPMQQSFQQLQPHYGHQFYPQPPLPPLTLTLEQQIALNELQKHALEMMLLHESFRKNPFQLRFHIDDQTDTNDLVNNASDDLKSDLFPIKESKEAETLDVQNPTDLYSPASKRKYLAVQNEKSTSPLTTEDKEAQNVPDIKSVEIQCDGKTADGCVCVCNACTCEKEMQTERKVTFQKEPHKILKKSKRRRREPTSRSVDDDSDSSSAYDDILA